MALGRDEGDRAVARDVRGDAGVKRAARIGIADDVEIAQRQRRAVAAKVGVATRRSACDRSRRSAVTRVGKPQRARDVAIERRRELPIVPAVDQPQRVFGVEIAVAADTSSVSRAAVRRVCGLSSKLPDAAVSLLRCAGRHVDLPERRVFVVAAKRVLDASVSDAPAVVRPGDLRREDAAGIRRRDRPRAAASAARVPPPAAGTIQR